MDNSFQYLSRRPGRLLPIGVIALFLLTSCTVVVRSGQPASKRVSEPAPQQQSQRLNIPPGHLPPPGTCRIWIPGAPPGHQSPAGDCAKLSRHVPPGAWLLHRDADDPEHIEVYVYNEQRPPAVTVIRYFDVSSGRFLRASLP